MRIRLNTRAASGAPRPTSLLTAHRKRRRARPGLTFVEVLLAVVLLGVGFIMIAAVFPVAIAQTGRTVDETHAAAVERSAVGFLQNAMTATSLPPDEGSPAVQSFADGDLTLQAAVRGNQIDTTDPRYAWVPVFRRDAGPYAQVFVIVAACRNRTAYQASDLYDGIGGLPAALAPRRINVGITPTSDGGALQIASDPDHVAGALGEGGFVIIANDQDNPVNNGRVYRLGASKDAANGVWSLDPRYGATASGDAIANAKAFILGRGYADPSNPAAGYGGEVQDVVVASSFVRLN